MCKWPIASRLSQTLASAYRLSIEIVYIVICRWPKLIMGMLCSNIYTYIQGTLIMAECDIQI